LSYLLGVRYATNGSAYALRWLAAAHRIGNLNLYRRTFAHSHQTLSLHPDRYLRTQKNPGSVRQPGSMPAGRQRSRTYQRINSPTGYITPSRRFDVSSTTPGTCASLGATRSVNAWHGRALDMTTCLQFWYLMGRGIV